MVWRKRRRGRCASQIGKQGEVGSLEHFYDVEVVSNDGSSKDSRSGNSVYSLDTHNSHSLRQTMEGGEAVTALRAALSGSGKIILKKTSISTDNSAGIQTESGEAFSRFPEWEVYADSGESASQLSEVCGPNG